MERIKSNTRLSPRKLRLTMYENYKEEVSKHVALKARKLAIKMIKGSAETQYKKSSNTLKRLRKLILEVQWK